jgi:amino acid adenylation domain-containing protein
VLTAWLQPTPGFTIPSPAELRSYLADLLPAHAIPSAFVTVDDVPMTANGKLDAAALPAPDRTHRSSTGIVVAPETELEAAVVAVWERILRIEPIAADDDFFALGGDSLAALEMLVAVEDALGVELPDEAAFVHSTPRALAAAIEMWRTSADRQAVPAGDQGPVALGPWTEDRPPPLSEGERGILYEQSLHPYSVRYNVGRLYRVHGPIDGPALAGALREAAAGHVPLRWTYGSRRRPLAPEEAVHVTLPIPVLPAAELGPLAATIHRQPFDLDAGPLLRVWIQPLDDGTTAVLLVCHHVSGDADSFDILWSQADRILHGAAGGHGADDSPSMPQGPVDYPSFAHWQLTTLDDADRRHWRSLPTPDPSGLRPPDRPGPDGFLTRAASVSPAELRTRAGATGFALAVAALAATLRRYHEGDQVELGVITSTRNHPAADELVGYFLNTVPLVLSCSPDATLEELTTQAGAAAAANLAHRHHPHARIVAERRQAGTEPRGLRVLVAYDELPATTLGGHRVDQRVLSNGEAVSDVTFFVEVRPEMGRVDLSLEHRGSAVDAERAALLLDDFDAMLRAAVRDPRSTVADARLVSPRSILTAGSAEDVDSLVPAILDHARLDPDAEAVRCGDDRLDWAGLERRSRRLAGRLRDAGVVRGDRVIVCLPRSVELVTAVLAVLRTGAAYVPIDPSYPEERITLIADRAAATAAVVAPGGPLTTVGDHLVKLEIVGEGSIPGDGADDAPTDDRGLDQVSGSDGAYVIFTSGSTGLPRGVPVTHRHLAASTLARDAVYDAGPERFLMVSSVAFDSSIVGLFWTLRAGGTVVLPTDREAHDPDALVDLLDRHGVSHFLAVPTLYQALLERGRDRTRWPRQVIVAGEACPAALVAHHHELRPGSRLTNEYGPTEATVWATAHHTTPGEDPVPIGRVVPGSWVAVVDDADRPVPHGVEGQLIIGGAGVVDGYLDEPETTANRFGTVEGGPLPGGRFFRTGDRAVIVDGRVGFLGRIDDQLNLGGVRAEPEEIERAILAHPSVAAAVVTVADPRPLAELLEDTPPDILAGAMARAATAADPAADLARRLRGADPRHQRLIAHIEATVAADGTSAAIDPSALRDLAGRTLPPLLRPSRYVVHPHLPRSPNGKIDRAAAQHLALTDPAGPSDPTDPRPPTDAAGRSPVDEVRRCFARLLRLPDHEVGVDQSFFDLGGHSLLAMELLLDLEERFGLEITAASLYEHPTARALASLVGAPEPTTQNRFLVPIQPRGSRPPIFGIHVLGVNSEFYRPLAARLGEDQPLFGLGLPTLMPDTSGPTDVAEVARRYADEIERCAPDGPLTLTAVSLGSVVAFELAHQLLARGRTVALVALFDAVGPHAGELSLDRRSRLLVHARELRAGPRLYVGARAANVRARLSRRAQQLDARARRRLGLELSAELRVREFIEANWRSQRAYPFSPYPGRLVVFKAGDDPFTAGLAASGAGWQPVVTGPLEVEVVPGGHLSMLAEPHVATLAPRLAAAQERALTEVGAGAGAPNRERPVTVRELDRRLRQALAAGHFGVEVTRWVGGNQTLDPDAAELLARADATGRAIATAARDEGRRIESALRAAGVPAGVEPVPERLAAHRLTVRLRCDGSDDGSGRVAEPGDDDIERTLQRCFATLDRLGYHAQPDGRPTDDPADGPRSWSFVRRDTVTTRLQLMWQREAINPPVGVVPPPDDRLFVGTPVGLVTDVLSLATPGPDDVVLDVGCGDGRVLIEAVRHFECRARGIEIDPELVTAARAEVAAAGFGDRIEIVEGDVREVGVGDATVVFCFLPPHLIERLLPGLLAQLPAGGRIVAHEQLGITWEVPPRESRLVMGEGITVAHVWTRDDNDAPPEP